MAAIDSKRMIITLMVLMMVVLAQGQTDLALVPPAPKPKTGRCVKRCLYKCIWKLSPQRIALCFGLCMIGCKLRPPQGVYKCTSDCANSLLNTYNPTDAEKVLEIFVGSCYKSCKHKKNH
ncbi:hypothetical protein DITRI_Ditri02bG0096900 [Diplodiscus trichospermus]